jgi:hypothetical protein
MVYTCSYDKYKWLSRHGYRFGSLLLRLTLVSQQASPTSRRRQGENVRLTIRPIRAVRVN